MDSSDNRVLVTGVPGRVGGVGSAIIEALRCSGQDMPGVAAEYADALGRPITYVDVPFDQWRDQELGKRGLSEHLFEHFLTMARLHAANRYDRLTHDVAAITGRPATTVRDFVAQHKALFDKHRNTLSPRPA